MEIFIGFIAAFGFNYAPRNWAMCQGQLFNIQDNQTLFALVNTYYGGDGRVTGGIPEMRGRAAIGYGNAPGLGSYTMGQKLGHPTSNIQILNMPSHTHIATVTPGGGAAGGDADVQLSTSAGTQKTPSAGDYLASGDVGTRADAQIYIEAASKGTTVSLGGVTGGGGGTVTVTNSDTGNSQPISIMQPYETVNYCMALLGLFPSRN